MKVPAFKVVLHESKSLAVWYLRRLM